MVSGNGSPGGRRCLTVDLVSLTDTDRELLDALPAGVSAAAFIRSALRRLAADERLHAEVLAAAVNESAAARSRAISRAT